MGSYPTATRCIPLISKCYQLKHKKGRLAVWEEKVQYTGDDLDGILGYLTLEGFNDVYITTGRPIIYKMDGIHHKLGERSLQDQEVRSFVTKVTGDPQAASELMSTTREFDRAYSVSRSEERCVG